MRPYNDWECEAILEWLKVEHEKEFKRDPEGTRARARAAMERKRLETGKSIQDLLVEFAHNDDPEVAFDAAELLQRDRGGVNGATH